jgi:endo-1,3(4)-beta-glucanase
MKNRGIVLFFAFVSTVSLAWHSNAQTVYAGSGSYTTVFPGVDAAGRNSYPSGTPQLSGQALGKPVPTNDWWSALIKSDQASNLFTYPYTLKTISAGLVVSYIPNGVIDDLLPVTVSVSDMSASRTTISDYSDWTATMNWNDGTHFFETTAGIAMPFLYFTKGSSDVAQVTVTSGTVAVSDEMLIITNAKNGADFAVYAPTGSTWTQKANSYTSTLNGKNYWSMAFIPLTASNVTTVANEYQKYAYVFPKNTTATWTYTESTSVLRTDFKVETEVKEGADTNMLIGLLPHQWGHLALQSPVPDQYSYASARGEIKTMAGNRFSVENTFHGIVPTLPYVDNYSKGFSPNTLTGKVEAIQNDALDAWTDSYNEGQVMNRLIQTARIADEIGDTTALHKMVSTIKERLEDWLKADNGEVAFLFYYDSAWSALLGYPGGYGQDSNLNDHHFHWGYFIHAAAFLEQYEPGWAAKWGEMVNLLVRDAASPDRNDTMFPYLRNFSPYAGHCWADGFASYPQGNNQESTSESMNFSSSLIHWGTITGNQSIRDLGIYLYTTEQTAIEEYWMDIHDRNFPSTQQYSLVSRVWGNSIDNGTFWTGDIAASYGIEMYPIQGGSLYLGQDTAYVTKLWKEIKTNTGIMSNEVNANLWHDVMWEYLAFIDPAQAITLYNSNPNRSLKFGISDAQTYHWLHAMNALGRVDANITANYPIAAAFILNGEVTYVAHNYSDAAITVTFSTGYQLVVPARKMVTSKDTRIAGTLASTFSQAYVGGSVQLKVDVSEGTPTRVEFMDGTTSLETLNSAPFTVDATNLTLGTHSFYAKVYDDEKFNVTNSVEVQVGRQQPYGGTEWALPCTIEAGKYDTYEGGMGQNIAYMDATTANSGDFRTDESVDAGATTAEGATVGWIATGEWLEYTVKVSSSGLYSFAFRYASGNVNGGGPFHLELDGRALSNDITVPSTSASLWDVWATKTVSDIPLTEGTHVLRVAFSYGEFNLGKMTFERTGDIPYSFPIAKAGGHVKVLLPETTAVLDASASTESGGKALTYEWTQQYGPSVIQFSDKTAIKPTISQLKEGIYCVKLTVKNSDARVDEEESMLLVSSSENVAPTVSLTSPSNDASYSAGTNITISATASDFDGSIQQVDFYQNETLIGTDDTAPYSISWSHAAGACALTAKATDDGGAVATSQTVNVTFSPVQSCSGTSAVALQGSFSSGYTYSFVTVGTDVTITFNLLDDKTGVVAYLWTQTPFSEKSMTNVEGNKFSTTFTGQEIGSTITIACKFAYSGGMSVTKYLSYVVGHDCDGGTGMETPAESAAFFYPDPAEKVLHFQLTSENNRLIVRDMLGKRVVDKTIPSSFHLNISTWKSGIYLLQVESPQGILRGKFIRK